MEESCSGRANVLKAEEVEFASQQTTLLIAAMETMRLSLSLGLLDDMQSVVSHGEKTKGGGSIGYGTCEQRKSKAVGQNRPTTAVARRGGSVSYEQGSYQQIAVLQFCSSHAPFDPCSILPGSMAMHNLCGMYVL